MATIGHDSPEDKVDLDAPCGESISFVKYTVTPPPSGNPSNEKDYLNYEFDRCNKIQRGIQFLDAKYGESISHWYALDADDLVRCTFIERMNSHKGREVIILDSGFQYDVKSRQMIQRNDFSQWCGSSFLVSRNCFEIPQSFEPPHTHQVPFRRYAHRVAHTIMIKEGYDVAMETNPEVMYVTGHSENLSSFAWYRNNWCNFKQKIYFFLNRIADSDQILKSFGFTE